MTEEQKKEKIDQLEKELKEIALAKKTDRIEELEKELEELKNKLEENGSQNSSKKEKNELTPAQERAADELSEELLKMWSAK